MRIRGGVRGIGLACVLFLVLCVSGHAASLPDLTGRWVTIQRMVAVAQLPFLGEVSIFTTIGLYSEITQSGSQLVLRDRYCFTDFHGSNDLFTSDISDASMHAIDPAPRLAELHVEDDEIRFAHDWHTEVRGAVLEDSTRDALPSEPDDPRVVDLESDGQLGMTIPARIIGLFGGETYVVQRFRYRLDGRMLDADTIVGTMHWSSEQEILAATDALLMSPYAQWTDPDPAKHRFVMRRIDDAWDCATLRDRVSGLLRILDSEVAAAGS